MSVSGRPDVHTIKTLFKRQVSFSLMSPRIMIIGIDAPLEWSLGICKRQTFLLGLQLSDGEPSMWGWTVPSSNLEMHANLSIERPGT